jgi:hypothetical protein
MKMHTWVVERSRNQRTNNAGLRLRLSADRQAQHSTADCRLRTADCELSITHYPISHAPTYPA